MLTKWRHLLPKTEPLLNNRLKHKDYILEHSVVFQVLSWGDVEGGQRSLALLSPHTSSEASVCQLSPGSATLTVSLLKNITLVDKTITSSS